MLHATKDNMQVHVDKTLELSYWIAENLSALKIPEPSNPKLHFAIELSQSIICMVDNEYYGSALVLLRPLKDAFIRGNWILYAASEEEFTLIMEGKEFPDNKRLIKHLPNKSRPEIDFRKVANILNDYTHVGIIQLEGRLGKNGLESNYSRDQILGALNISIDLGLASAIFFAKVCNNSSLETAFTVAFNARSISQKNSKSV